MLLRAFGVGSALILQSLGGKKKILPIDGGFLRYQVIGPDDGEPWLLLHGMGTTGASWAPVVRALRGECRILVPELSAIGGSEVPGGAVELERAPELLAALLDVEFGARPVTVAGISLGAWMAVLLARAHPALLARLVLVDAAGYGAQDWERISSQVQLDTPKKTHELLGALWAKVPWYLRLGAPLFYKVYTSRAVTRILETTREEHAYWDADLATVDVPTAVIWGEEDGLFRVEVARAMAEALPQSTLVVLENCGHVPPWERPGATLAALDRFRRAHPVSA
jgi:abhydrolase domain-containing protein 6